MHKLFAARSLTSALCRTKKQQQLAAFSTSLLFDDTQKQVLTHLSINEVTITLHVIIVAYQLCFNLLYIFFPFLYDGGVRA